MEINLLRQQYLKKIEEGGDQDDPEVVVEETESDRYQHQQQQEGQEDALRFEQTYSAIVEVPENSVSYYSQN